MIQLKNGDNLLVNTDADFLGTKVEIGCTTPDWLRIWKWGTKY